MTTGDWVQSGIGVLGILATALVAWLVFRLEGKVREQHRREDRAAAEEERLAEADREQRIVRSERHKDDYRLALEILGRLEKVCEQMQWAVRSADELDEFGINELTDSLEQIGKRVDALSDALHSVRVRAVGMQLHAFPPLLQFQLVTSTEGDEQADRLASLVRDSARAAVRQYIGAEATMRSIRIARKAIDHEWSA